MSDLARCDTATGDLISAPHTERPDDAAGVTIVELPAGWADDGKLWSTAARSFVEAPPVLSPRDVLNLYTTAERHRILTSAIPQVQELVAYLLTEVDGVVAGSTTHVQGTALIDGLGLLDAPGRAARIVTGLPPETGQ